MISTHDIIVRLAVTVLLSGAIGFERSLTGKVAGMRTHILVGLGAAIFTLVSGYAFATGPSNADRIAAQIVTGIGFVAGGVILKERGTVKGITTAAGLWTVASIGMAAGAGLFALSVAGTIAVLLTLVVLRYVEARLPRRRHQTWELDLTLPADADSTQLRSVLEPHCFKHWLIALTEAETKQVTLGIEMKRNPDIEAVSAQLRALGACSITWRATAELET
jgi:putative Mg2+ transporter-C (MgtC) family protein